MKALPPVALSLLAFSALFLAGNCGLFTAPVSAPAAVLENANFNLSFQLLHSDGTPLRNVILEQHLSHHFWTPIAGGTDTNENKNIFCQDQASINERGSDIRCAFKREGFYDNFLWMRASDTRTLLTNYGQWPYSTNFPIVLAPISVDAPLRL